MAFDRTLYFGGYGGGYIFAWRALLMLEEKGLEYEAKQLSSSNGDLKTPEYLALNPRGQVPTFQDGDIVVNESLAVVLYLSNTYPDPPLIPTDKKEQATTFQRFIEADSTLKKLLDAISMKYRGLVKTPEDEEKFQSNLAAAKVEVKFWDEHLSKTKFAAGDEFSIADIVAIPMVLIMERVGANFSEFPNVKRYVEMVKERPSVKRTWPPHWADSDGPNYLDSQI